MNVDMTKFIKIVKIKIKNIKEKVIKELKKINNKRVIEENGIIGVSGGVKYNIDDYKNNSNSINVVKGEGNNDNDKDNENENENENYKSNNVIDSNKSNFMGVSRGVCTATPGSQSKS